SDHDADLARVHALLAAETIQARRDAEHILTRRLHRAPADVEALMLLGRVHLAQSKPDQARHDFQRVVALVPGQRAAHRELGLLWQREWAQFLDRHVLERAVSELELAVPSSCDSMDADAWLGISVLGALQCELGYSDRAVAV